MNTSVQDKKSQETKKETILFTDEYLDFVYKNSSKIKTSEKNKKKSVF